MMTKKVLAIILLLFIIVVSLSFSHFLIPSSYIENMETNEDEDADEDVLLNSGDDTSSSSAPSPSNETKSIPKGYGMPNIGKTKETETFVTMNSKKPSSEKLSKRVFEDSNDQAFKLLKF